MHYLLVGKIPQHIFTPRRMALQSCSDAKFVTNILRAHHRFLASCIIVLPGTINERQTRIISKIKETITPQYSPLSHALGTWRKFNGNGTLQQGREGACVENVLQKYDCRSVRCRGPMQLAHWLTETALPRATRVSEQWQTVPMCGPEMCFCLLNWGVFACLLAATKMRI